MREMAQALNRSRGTISNRLQVLGVKSRGYQMQGRCYVDLEKIMKGISREVFASCNIFWRDLL